MLDFYHALTALPAALWNVFLAFIGSGSHAARSQKLPIVEGLIGFICGAPVGLVCTKLLLLITVHYLKWPIGWGDVWPATYLFSYLGNDILGGADQVGQEFRSKPIPFILDLISSFLTKIQAFLQTLKPKP